ncbi:MAG: hypothetical protein M4579_004958 [Chaenotheca gracillima]|nr:MAG: hypothetical protein M4579_004958 [Chaenotheca gracillima]
MERNLRSLGTLSVPNGVGTGDVSRATSPGGDWRSSSDNEEGDHLRPHTFPYTRLLPYEVEDNAQRLRDLDEMIKNLYIAIETRDFYNGCTHWIREIRNWLDLKFDLPRGHRVKLVKICYELALTPGMDPSIADRWAGLFMTLTKKKHYLRSGKDVYLDWRIMLRELKAVVLPSEPGPGGSTTIKRSLRTLVKLSTFAQLYFDPAETLELFDEVLPFFTTSNLENAFIVIYMLNLLMPTMPPENKPELYPQRYLPTFFHLWQLMNRSRGVDYALIDIFSRLSRDFLPYSDVTFGECGIFTKKQSALIFTSLLRMLDLPVGQSPSVYSPLVDIHQGMAVLLDRDHRKHPFTHNAARWIVMSLSPACLDDPESILAGMEGLIQAIETFFHPSNSGSWSRSLTQMIFYMADFFVMRWNKERSGEWKVPKERMLNDELKRRFVLAIREPTFMSIYAKSASAMNYALSTLQALAFLEPNLILPGALQRIYPSMQGLVEVHRTTSSLRSLQILSRSLATTKGFRCHVTSLLGLALPGIDANDLDKTSHSLSFLQAMCHCIPLHDLTKGGDDVMGSSLAVDWITSEVDNLERKGSTIELHYDTDLDDNDEAMILRSSTAALGEFITSLLGRIFTLLENLPDPTRLRSGSPEETVINSLPGTLAPFFSSLSPELYDLALNKIADFIANHVIHPARDAMAFICNALCKVNPEKAMKRLIPALVQAIRMEISENGAGSTRNTSFEVLPRDRALVWNISMLSMAVVQVGEAILEHKQELYEIALYMQQHCKGIATNHASNYIHHLLLTLTSIYTIDFPLYEPEVMARGIQVEDWGTTPRPQDMTVKWHVPNAAEIDFAVELFESMTNEALGMLESLTSDDSPIKRDGTGKAWTDEMSKNLTLLKLILSGVSFLMDPNAVSGERKPYKPANGDTAMSGNDEELDRPMDDEALLAEWDDPELRRLSRYPDGKSMDPSSPHFEALHRRRNEIGHALHRIHKFLVEKQEDDVTSFVSLYTTYRAWFADVGLERSAHIFDKVSRHLVTDIHIYKLSGMHKDYPRPLLVRRAYVYHLQRLRYNSVSRYMTELDETLLLDLAESCVSEYTDIRRHAQLSSESASKVMRNSRSIIIPPVVKAFEEGAKANDYARIKGAMCTLVFGGFSKPMGRNWLYAPRIMRTFLNVSTVDKPSIQKLTHGSTYTVMEFGRPASRLVIMREGMLDEIVPADVDHDYIAKKREYLNLKRKKTEARKAEFSMELVNMASTSPWKKLARSVSFLLLCGMRFKSISSDEMVDLFTKGTINSHPSLRGLYSGSLVALLSFVEMRALCQHDYENYICDRQTPPSREEIDVPPEDENRTFTRKYLSSFAEPASESYVDHDYPGWLVWSEKMPVYRVEPSKELAYDEAERRVLVRAGQSMDRAWFNTFIGYLKQEPRDGGSDRFRMATAMLLSHAVGIVLDGMAATTWDELKQEIRQAYGDGSDKHQHRATAEMFGALLMAVNHRKIEKKKAVWEFVYPRLQQIFENGLTPDNSSYWTTCLHVMLEGKDPRRSWQIVNWVSNFRLDMSSNAAFKESSKIHLLHQCVSDSGWHYQLDRPILDDFIAHLDHPYKGVRESMGITIAAIYRTRYHEGFKDVSALLEANRKEETGIVPYRPSDQFVERIEGVFAWLEKSRKERQPGQQTPSSYTSGSKTVLLWLDSTLSSFECTTFSPFIPDTIMEALLHMMDVKEDPELQSLAYMVFRHLPNVPHPRGEDDVRFIQALIRIGKTGWSWHQRLRILINIQVLYFRRLFLMAKEDQFALFECAIAMLSDPQLEVRIGASTTLSGMIRCSPLQMREDVLTELRSRFLKILDETPMPKRQKTVYSATASVASSGTGTPTPEHQSAILKRHAAVLGLGALIQAFPYTSPPPTWLPGTLATLSNKASGDPGVVGKSVKTIISDFKKTRQDTWHVDVKAFSPEQLDDLEGVLWKSYFA